MWTLCECQLHDSVWVRSWCHVVKLVWSLNAWKSSSMNLPHLNLWKFVDQPGRIKRFHHTAEAKELRNWVNGWLCSIETTCVQLFCLAYKEYCRRKTSVLQIVPYTKHNTLCLGTLWPLFSFPSSGCLPFLAYLRNTLGRRVTKQFLLPIMSWLCPSSMPAACPLATVLGRWFPVWVFTDNWGSLWATLFRMWKRTSTSITVARSAWDIGRHEWLKQKVRKCPPSLGTTSCLHTCKGKSNTFTLGKLGQGQGFFCQHAAGKCFPVIAGQFPEATFFFLLALRRVHSPCMAVHAQPGTGKSWCGAFLFWSFSGALTLELGRDAVPGCFPLPLSKKSGKDPLNITALLDSDSLLSLA